MDPNPLDNYIFVNNQYNTVMVSKVILPFVPVSHRHTDNTGNMNNHNADKQTLESVLTLKSFKAKGGLYSHMITNLIRVNYRIFK